MTAYASCARCGRRLTIGGRTGPVPICRDCRDVDPAYIAVLLAS